MLEKVRALDRYHVPTRYPDAHSSWPAFRHCAEGEAREAVTNAAGVLGTVRLRVWKVDRERELVRLHGVGVGRGRRGIFPAGSFGGAEGEDGVQSSEDREAG